MKRLTIVDIIPRINERGCQYLSGKYENCYSKLNLICSCGKHFLVSWDSFKQGRQRCLDCGRASSSRQQMVSESVFNATYENKGCEPQISYNEYTNNTQKIPYICKCGSERISSYANFRLSKKCQQCVANERKHTTEYVTALFEESGCTLMSEYQNARDPIEYICECGNLSTTRLYNFLSGKRCKICGINKSSDSKKHSTEEVGDLFKNRGMVLLSEYVSYLDPLRYRCDCGNVDYISLCSFSANSGKCKKCYSKELSERQRKYDVDFVKSYFESLGAKWLEESYFSNHFVGRAICCCGEKFKTTFERFKSGGRCKSCGIKKISGSNSYMWNSDLTDEERELNKSRQSGFEYRQWRKQVLQRDKFTCQSCHQRGGKLRCHHLDGWHWCIEKRYDPLNGVALCETCHDIFHNIYGRRMNTKIQFEEWLS